MSSIWRKFFFYTFKTRWWVLNLSNKMHVWLYKCNLFVNRIWYIFPGLLFNKIRTKCSTVNVNCFIKEHFCDDGKSCNLMKHFFLSLENANPFPDAPLGLLWTFWKSLRVSSSCLIVWWIAFLLFIYLFAVLYTTIFWLPLMVHVVLFSVCIKEILTKAIWT